MKLLTQNQSINKFFITGARWIIITLAGAGLLLFPLKIKAQDMEVGIYGGVSYYLGDLNPGKHFANLQPAYGATLRYTLDPRWALKFGVYEGKVIGNSTQTNFLPGRDLKFSSQVTDISAETEFNFFPYMTGSWRNFISPYIYAGFGVFFFNPMSGSQQLRPLGTEGQNDRYLGRKPYNTYNFSIPFGLGVKLSVSRRIGMTLFWEMHKTFTDYLDDVSTTYYLEGSQINPDDTGAVLSDPTRNHEPGMQRGNSRNNDWYSFSGITFSYRFDIHGSKRCRDMKYK
ncbi:MAG: DUF6089 family protein [Bacteroidota bacterium]|nr:DUF6089 family protein [Bacteroidota bacterium]